MKLNEVAYRGPDWKENSFRRHVLKLEQVAKDFLAGNKLVKLNKEQMSNSLTGKGQTWKFGFTYKRPGIDDEAIEISSLYKGNDPAVKAKLKKREGIVPAEDRFSKITRTVIGLVDRLKKEDNELLSLKFISFYAKGEDGDDDHNDNSEYAMLPVNGEHRKFASMVSKFDSSVQLVFMSQKDIDSSNKYDALVKEGAGINNRRETAINLIKKLILDTTKRHGITVGTYDIQSDVKILNHVIEDDNVIQQSVIWPLISDKDKQIYDMYKGSDRSVKMKLFDRLVRTRWEKVNKCAIDIVRVIETGAYLKSQLALLKFDYKLEYIYSDFITRLARYTPQDFMNTFSKREPANEDLENTRTILIFRFTLPDDEEE